MQSSAPRKIPTGVPGLDFILEGGLPANRLHLIQGAPGTGKTTLALQFLLEGVARGETVLYVTLSETPQELRDAAASHGWSLDDVPMFELSDASQLVDLELDQTVFPPSEVELTETTRELLETLKEQKPSRVVFDTLSEMRLLAGEPLRYRRQILLLKQHILQQNCTVLLLEDDLEASSQVQSMVTGVIELENAVREYGSTARRLRVVKMRGTNFLSGFHDAIIKDHGFLVYPRLVASDTRQLVDAEVSSTGSGALDQLLGGGLDHGTATLLMGPPGSGKSTFVAQVVAAAASRGERSVLFLFDERPHTLLSRCDALRIGLRESIDDGLITLQQVDPAELGPGEFAAAVQEAIGKGARFIAIDSVLGYLNAMPGERHLVLQLHELLTFLGQASVVSLLVLGVSSLQQIRQLPIDISYLADNVIYFDFTDFQGSQRRTLRVNKRRAGHHEEGNKPFRLGNGGFQLLEGVEVDGLRP